ncbi:MAG: hypothetical protein OXR62_10975 [Ahrensia sp.]|nr:hypothetical protein [Ahrensia sp.]
MASHLHDIVGADDYLRLLDHAAGTRLFIPRNPNRSSLTEAIGEDAARLLSEAYGGEHLKIPLDRVFRARALKSAGLSNGKIARRLGITEDGVAQLLKKQDSRAAADPRQIELAL